METVEQLNHAEYAMIDYVSTIQRPDQGGKPASQLLKTVMDFAISLIALLAAIPVMALIALAIRLDSPGPATFRGKRIGKDGEEFECHKFRTMFQNNEAILEQHLSKNPAAREEWERFSKLKGEDPRVTRVGSMLRKTSMDELPQFFDVLCGRMSVIGPRPYLPREKADMGMHSEVILSVKPGITGLWQVSGRNEIELKDRVRLETWYVRNWSLWLDITILFRTVGAVIKREGAY